MTKLYINDLVGSGGYSDIFFVSMTNRVYKVFKSFKHRKVNELDFDEEIFNDFRRKVFITEKKAYEKIQDSQLLLAYTPEYFGHTLKVKIYDEEEQITHEYLDDCCFGLEYIRDAKPYDLYPLLESSGFQEVQNKLGFNWEQLESEFRNHGVFYTKDSLALITEEEFKIIDFVTIDPFEFEPVLE